MFTHVLVPFDGSVQSQHALNAALEMAKGDEPAHVTVLEVAPPMSFDDTTFEVAARMAGVPEVSEAAKDETRKNYAESQKHVIQDQIQEFFNSVLTTSTSRSSSRTAARTRSSPIMRKSRRSTALSWGGAVWAPSARHSAAFRLPCSGPSTCPSWSSNS